MLRWQQEARRRNDPGIPSDLLIPPRPAIVEALREQRRREEPSFARVENLIGFGHLAEHLHHPAHRASEDVERDAFAAAVLDHFDLSATDCQDLLGAGDAD